MSREISGRDLKRARSKYYEEGYADGVSDNLWLMTFGDLFTLLLAFFILLLVISVPDAVKFKETMEMLQRALTHNLQVVKVETYKDQLRNFLDEANLSNVASVEETTRGFKLTVLADFSFESGQVTFTPDQIKLLDGIAPIIKKIPNRLEITAHTDIQPIHTKAFSSNRELSAARAASVSDYLVQNRDIQGARIQAIGSGEFYPRHLPPNIPKNMEKNRRLEIEIMNEGL